MLDYLQEPLMSRQYPGPVSSLPTVHGGAQSHTHIPHQQYHSASGQQVQYMPQEVEGRRNYPYPLSLPFYPHHFPGLYSPNSLQCVQSQPQHPLPNFIAPLPCRNRESTPDTCQHFQRNLATFQPSEQVSVSSQHIRSQNQLCQHMLNPYYSGAAASCAHQEQPQSAWVPPCQQHDQIFSHGFKGSLLPSSSKLYPSSSSSCQPFAVQDRCTPVHPHHNGTNSYGRSDFGSHRGTHSAVVIPNIGNIGRPDHNGNPARPSFGSSGDDQQQDHAQIHQEQQQQQKKNAPKKKKQQQQQQQQPTSLQNYQQFQVFPDKCTQMTNSSGKGNDSKKINQSPGCKPKATAAASRDESRVGCNRHSRPGGVSESKPKDGQRRQKGVKGDAEGACAARQTQEDAGHSRQQQKEKLTEEMRQSILQRFPKLRHQTYSVPPVRHNKTKYHRLQELSTCHHDVMEQRELQSATLLGDQTEDTISRCMTKVVSSLDEPLFILSNYQFDDYLFFLKSGAGGGGSVRSSDDSGNNNGGANVGAVPCSTKGKDTSWRPNGGGSGILANAPDVTTKRKRKPQMSESSSDSGVLQSPSGIQADGSFDSHSEDFPQAQDLSEEGDSDSQTPISPLQSDGSDNSGLFPTPRDMDISDRRGDFDKLVISPRLGLIIIEAKTLLGFESTSMPQAEQSSSMMHSPREDQDDFVQEVVDTSQTDQSEGLILNAEVSSDSERGSQEPQHRDMEEFENHNPKSDDEGFLSSPEFQDSSSSGTLDSVSHNTHNSDSFRQHECGKEVHSSSPVVSELVSVLSSGTRDNSSFDEDFRKTISKSLNQFRKEEKVLRHLTQDLLKNPQISKILALPNTSGGQLRRLLGDPQLCQEVSEELGTANLEETLMHCLTSELVADPEPIDSQRDATCEVLTPLMQWWSNFEQRLVSRRQTGIRSRTGESDEVEEEHGDTTWEISWDIYEQIIARFCGPYSRLKSRTVAECIHLTGMDFGRSILRQEQLKLMDSASPFMCLSGPPGSGKTLLLALKAAEWAKQGDQVVVVCAEGVNWGSLISWTLYQRVLEHLKDYKQEETRRQAFITSGPQPCKRTVDKRKPWSHKQKKTHKSPSSVQTKGTDSCPTSANQTGSEDVSMHADIAENVHRVLISTGTNIQQFVEDLVEKHRACNLRVIVDERPRYVTLDRVYQYLSDARSSLHQLRAIYTSMRDMLCGRPQESQEAAAAAHVATETRELFLPKIAGLSPSEKKGPEQRESCLSEKHFDLASKSEHTEWMGEECGVTTAGHVGSLMPQEDMKVDTDAKHVSQSLIQNQVSQTQLVQGSERQKAEDEKEAPPHGQNQGDHFTTMADRMVKMEDRFSRMRARGSAGPDILRSEPWQKKLEEMYMIFTEARQLMMHVQPRVTKSPAVYQQFVGSLEKLSELMISAMGNMYHAYISLNFFQVDHFFTTMRKVASRDGHDSCEKTGNCEISLWTASVYHYYIPAGFEKGELSCSIRCTPNIQRILKWTEKDYPFTLGYSYITRGCDVSPPLPSDGPPVAWMDHSCHKLKDAEINDCSECGNALAEYLLGTLDLKVFGKTRVKRGKGQGQQSQLYFHDVIISGSPIHNPDCAFIQAMSQKGIQFEVEHQNLKTPPPYTNKIFVIGGATLQGVEAKIVVFVPELKRITDDERKATAAMMSSVTSPHPEKGCCNLSKAQEKEILQRLGAWNREYIWHVASRSLSHLIVFHN